MPPPAPVINTRCMPYSSIDAAPGILLFAGERVPLVVERLAYPIDDRPYATRTAQVAVNDDPVFGGEFRYWRSQSFEQRVFVRGVARQDAAAGPGADGRMLHRRVGGPQRNAAATFLQSLLYPARV